MIFVAKLIRDKSVFEKKLSGETNTDYKDITDFISHIAKRNTMDFHETW